LKIKGIVENAPMEIDARSLGKRISINNKRFYVHRHGFNLPFWGGTNEVLFLFIRNTKYRENNTSFLCKLDKCWL
jgi:hypothetical protein